MDAGGAMWYTMSSLESMRQGIELLSTGQLRDRYGQLVVESKDISFAALLGKVFGFNSVVEGEISRLKTGYKALEERTSSKQTRAMNKILKLEGRKEWRAARELQKKAGITERQKKSARKKQRQGVQDLLRESMRTSTRSEELYRDALEDLPQ